MINNKWSAPISFDAKTVARVLRDVLDELKFKFKREKGEKAYTQFLVLLPLPRFAYVFRFIVEEPKKFIISTYDTKPAHSGTMSFIEAEMINDENIESIRLVLSTLAKKLPREPWKFTFAQRIQHGILTPEFFKAKKLWGIWVR